MGGADYTDSRLSRAAKEQNGYTDGVSTEQAKAAQKAIEEAEKSGAKIEYEKVDVYVDKDGLLRGDPVIRSW